MLQAIINRRPEEDGATIGSLTLQGIDHPPLWTLELPAGKRIAAGTYKCIPHGWDINSQVEHHCVWEITGVPDHTAVLLHEGNTVLDTKACVLVGQTVGTLNGMPAVLHSKDAIKELQDIIGPVNWMLTIND